VSNNGPKPPIPSSGLQSDPGQYIRCPIPPIGIGSTDTLRQFYNKGAVPQYRSQMLRSALPGGGATGGGGSNTIESSTFSPAEIVPSGGGSTSGIFTASITTPVLNQNQNYSGTILLSRMYAVLTVTVNAAARVRLYVNKSSAANDLGRPATTPVTLGLQTGLVGDWLLQTPTEFIWLCSPAPVGYNADQPSDSAGYITVTNPSASSSTIQVSMVYARLEA
jgi:hypothetical protein